VATTSVDGSGAPVGDADGVDVPAPAAEPFSFVDPLSSLPETAQNLVLAAKRIIVSEGFDALSLSAVSVASGENKAMVAYYFGNKAGLVAAVLDSVIHDEYLGSSNRMRDVTPEERPRRLVEEMRRMDEASAEFRVFFELLPRVLRNELLRRRMVVLYTWYWRVKLEWLGIDAGPAAFDDPDLLGFAQLLSAVIDGLAIQAAIDPDVDLDNPYRVLTRLLERSLPTYSPSATGADDGAS